MMLRSKRRRCQRSKHTAFFLASDLPRWSLQGSALFIWPRSSLSFQAFTRPGSSGLAGWSPFAAIVMRPLRLPRRAHSYM